MRISNQILFIVLVFFSLLNAGCKKDPLNDLELGSNQAVLRDGTGIPLTIEEAETYFNSYDCTHSFSLDSFHIQSLDPIWAFALPIQVNGQEIHVVPVSNDLDSIFPNSDYNLLFYRDTLGAIHFNLFISTSTTGTMASSVDEMTGFWLQIAESNELVSGYAIHEGHAIPFGVDILSQFQNQSHSELRGGGPICPGFGGGGFDWDLFWIKLNSGWGSFWDNFLDYFEGNWSGGGSSGGSSGITFTDPNQSSNSTVFFSWSGAGTGAWTSSGPTGTTPLNIQGLFNNDLFNRGFRRLKTCGNNQGDGQGGSSDQQGLAVAMAEVMGSANQFHHVFSIAMDMYLVELKSGNNQVQLSDLFADAANLQYYFNQYTFQYINQEQSILPSAYLYHQMAWYYKECRSYEGPVGVGNESAICTCIAQQTVENAIRDYILQYASAANNPFLPVNMSQTERDNWQLLKDLNNSFNLSTEDLLALSFTPFKPSDIDYAFHAKSLVANRLHTELKSEYADVYTWGDSELENLLNQENGADKFMAAFVLFTSYVNEVGDPPSDPYMWQLMYEVFRDEMAEVVIEFIPYGVGNAAGIYNNYNNGDYWGAALEVAFLVIPFDEIWKVWKNSPEAIKGYKACKKVVVLWNKLLTLPGGQKVLNEMPQSWKNLPGSKLADNSKGLTWKVDNHNEFRLMEEVTGQHIQNKLVPYTVMKKNGKFLGVNNKFIYKANGKYYEEGVEITLNQYEEWSHVPISQLTDAILNKYFY